MWLGANIKRSWSCCRESAGEISEAICTRQDREAFQNAVSRRNPNLVTPVELDFVFPPHSRLLEQCQLLISADSNYWALSR